MPPAVFRQYGAQRPSTYLLQDGEYFGYNSPGDYIYYGKGSLLKTSGNSTGQRMGPSLGLRMTSSLRGLRNTIANAFGRNEDAIDSAQVTPSGIDLAQSNLDMQIKRDGDGVPLPISQQNLDNIRIDGLVPVILSIQPAANVSLLN